MKRHHQRYCRRGRASTRSPRHRRCVCGILLALEVGGLGRGPCESELRSARFTSRPRRGVDRDGGAPLRRSAGLKLPDWDRRQRHRLHLPPCVGTRTALSARTRPSRLEHRVPESATTACRTGRDRYAAPRGGGRRARLQAQNSAPSSLLTYAGPARLAASTLVHRPRSWAPVPAVRPFRVDSSSRCCTRRILG